MLLSQGIAPRTKKLTTYARVSDKIPIGTLRKYWIHVPAQYNANSPACVLVFQDGARAVNPGGVPRVPQVLDNSIARRQIPVMIGFCVEYRVGYG